MSTTTSIAAPVIVRKKETFDSEVFVNVDGVDTKFYIKCVVNYERLTFKATPVITMIHGFDQEVQDALIASTKICRARCVELLDKYRQETGIGAQQNLFDQSAANSQPRASKKAAKQYRQLADELGVTGQNN